MKEFSPFFDLSDLNNLNDYSRVGIEKESIRIDERGISKKTHPSSLGSSLCNKFITTDFSEAQLELVTPPFENKQQIIECLNDMHHFVSQNIGTEMIWPFSISMAIDSEKNIKIAEFGDSNIGKFRHIYRKGLSQRYSKEMQIISGTHFNFSLPESVFSKSIINKKIQKDQTNNIKSNIYLGILRNNIRINWLILYLFGASPILNNSLVSDSKPFRSLEKNYSFMEYATSLRMSQYGYKNSKRESFRVSLNSLEGYTKDLKKASKTKSKDFLLFEDENDVFANQLNPNILQIEDEYYAVARIKSASKCLKPLSSKLISKGIDFIEFRSLDLDPFSPTGVNLDTIYFLDLYMWYCFLTESKPISEDEYDEIEMNEQSVALNGRSPNLKLFEHGKKKHLSSWSAEIFEGLYKVAEALDSKNSYYTNALNNIVPMIKDPSKTISARVIQESYEKRSSFEELGYEISLRNKEYYSGLDPKQNPYWDTLEKESNQSHLKQKSLEEQNQEPFEEFLERYFRA